MTDEHHDDDVLARLRAVDPVPEPVSHPSDAPVRATFEEILMSRPVTDAPAADRPAPGSPTRSSWYRDPRILGAAAALVLVAGVVGAIVAGGSDGEEPVDSALPTAPTDTPDEALDRVIEPTEPNDGSELTSCVAQYGLDTLAERDHAFDGTVTAVDGSEMTFEVHEWFAGGEGDTVTLDHQGLVGMLFAPDGPALEPGTRVLTAGDGGFVWSCGFTQLHDPALADEWRATLAG